MPRGDGTGPMGIGPITGRGAGYCAGHAMPGFASYGGVGCGRGMGRGFKRMPYFTGASGGARNSYVRPVHNGQAFDERAVLQEQEEFLEEQLKQVKDRLKRFEEEK